MLVCETGVWVPILVRLLYFFHISIGNAIIFLLLYPLQKGYTPLHLAAEEGHTTCVERLLSTHGIDVNIKNKVNNIIKDILGKEK